MADVIYTKLKKLFHIAKIFTCCDKAIVGLFG